MKAALWEKKGISVYNNLEEDPMLGTREANVMGIDVAHVY